MSIRPNAGAYVERNSGLLTYNSFSRCVWIYPVDRAGEAVIYKQDTSDGSVYDEFKLTTGGLLRISTTAGSVSGASVVPLDTWSHIGMIRNGNTRTMFLNGVSQVTNSAAQTFTKSIEKIGGNYLATVTANFLFAGEKSWNNTILTAGEFGAEMYGYPTVKASPFSESHFLTNTDMDNRTGGVDWTAFGTLTTNASEPAFLSSGGGGGLLIRRRRSYLGGSL